MLDAAKMELEGQLNKGPVSHIPGRIALFTLPGHKKAGETPRKTESLPSSVVPSSQNRSDVSSSVSLTSSSLSSGGDQKNLDSLQAPHRKAKRSSAARNERKQRRDKRKEEKREAFRRASSAPEYEVARRKSRRKLYRIVAWTFVIAVSAIVVAGVGSFGYSSYQSHANSVQVLSGAIENISKVDETIVAVDDFIHDPFSKTASVSFDDIEGEIEAAQENLASAQSDIESTIEHLGTSREREVADNALLSIQSRAEMLTAARAVLGEAESAADAMEYIEQAWSRVLNADKLARESALLANETTQENIAASKEKTLQAQALLSEALAYIDKAAQTYPSMDVTKMRGYVQKRYEAFDHAIASDEAFAAEDTQKAMEENDAYNKLDAEAAALADELLVDPVDYVREAYSKNTVEHISAFDAAKESAASTDSVVRSYHAV